jgi:Fur family ferric uptake transcriptional regulator
MASVPTGDDEAAELARRLRAQGLRWTQQRAEVLAAVRALGHGTPEQIAAAAPNADLATVYRTLELLEDLGVVAHTHLDHGAPAYRPADDQHIHVVCHRCSAVIPAPDALADELVRRLALERDFAVDLAHFTVFGICSSCRDAGESPADAPRHRPHRHGPGPGGEQNPGPKR